MSKRLKSSEENHLQNDDLHSITNVKELDAQLLQLSQIDQFKNLSLSFYNDIPLHFSQTSTNFTNKSKESTEQTTKVNSYEKSRNLMGKIFKNTTKKTEIKPESKPIDIKPKPLIKPKNTINFKTFYLSNRFPNNTTLNKSSSKVMEASVSKSKYLNSTNFSQIQKKPTKGTKPQIKKLEIKQEINKLCVSNVKICLKDPHKSLLNTSFNERSLSQKNKKTELNSSFSSNPKSFRPVLPRKILNKKVTGTAEIKPESFRKNMKKIEEKVFGIFKKK